MSDFFSYDGRSTTPEPGRVEDSRAILGELSGEEWEKFIGFAARRRYPAGAVIIQAGASQPALCLIASGQVEVHGHSVGPAGPQEGSTRRGEGEAFGLLSFLDGAPSTITATVARTAPAEVLWLTPEALEQLAAWQPRIAMTLLRDLGAHLAARLRRLQPGD
jgi:CRP-like cAMP-binding protein